MVSEETASLEKRSLRDVPSLANSSSDWEPPRTSAMESKATIQQARKDSEVTITTIRSASRGLFNRLQPLVDDGPPAGLAPAMLALSF